MWKWVFGGILLGFMYESFAEVPDCPPSDQVFPCYCKKEKSLTSIGCEGIRNVDEIKRVLENTKGLNMSFGFWKSKLGDIPSNFFEGQQSIDLHFENCEIGSFGDRPFTGLENTLKNLYIYGCVDKSKKDLKTFPLGHLKKLEDLSFEANDIKKFGNEWFEGGPTALRMLMLEANDVEEIGDRAFASLVNVEHIWMGDNRYKIVKRSMFPRPANKLTNLEMSFSGIEVLPEDIFEDMPVLKSVIVSGNKLKSAPEKTWGKIWNQLDLLYLERNPGFQCDENLKWIYQRKLPRILTGECTDEKHYRKKLSALTLADFN